MSWFKKKRNKFITWAYAKYVFVPALKASMDKPVTILSVDDMEVEFVPDFELPKIH